MKLAVISDVHGNAEALETVLEDIARRRIDAIFDLGDRVSGPLWPARTFALFEEQCIAGVRGNHDRQLGDRPRTDMGPSDAYAFDVLGADQIAALTALPLQFEPYADILAFHAHLEKDDRYLTETISDGMLVHRNVDAIEFDLAAHRQNIVLCGHSHRPFACMTAMGRLALNPGSVGCPAYGDDDPPHVSESGSPHARYAVLTLDSSVAGFELIALRYDWEKAARQAERNSRPDWAHALRTGRMPRASSG